MDEQEFDPQSQTLCLSFQLGSLRKYLFLGLVCLNYITSSKQAEKDYSMDQIRGQEVRGRKREKGETEGQASKLHVISEAGAVAYQPGTTDRRYSGIYRVSDINVH